MNIPSQAQAEAYLSDAALRNPGPWVAHSQKVAEAAYAIATQLASLSPDHAYICGLLHDIGRRSGISNMRHILDGYLFLEQEGYSLPARICLTHSFPIQDPQVAAGVWDVTPQEYAFVATTLAQFRYDELDRLIQLCDALALPTGFCLLEKRFVEVVLRHGWNSTTVDKWHATMALKHHFESQIGRSIYQLLPGIVETTFETRLDVV